jgi:hypothetical protein
MSPELVDYVIGYVVRDSLHAEGAMNEYERVKESIEPPHKAVSDAITKAKLLLDEQFITPSREKAMVHTKLDEAILWLREVRALPR